MSDFKFRDITDKVKRQKEIVVSVINDVVDKRGGAQRLRWSNDEFLDKVELLFPCETPFKTIYQSGYNGGPLSVLGFKLNWSEDKFFNTLKTNLVAVRYNDEYNNFKVLPLGKGLFEDESKWYFDIDALRRTYDKQMLIADACWEVFMKIGTPVEELIDSEIVSLKTKGGFDNLDDLKNKFVTDLTKIMLRKYIKK